MAAALLSSFHDMKQRRRKSVRVTFTMRTASFSVVRFFSLLLSTAWVGLVGYREIPIRTLHLNVHTHTHTHTEIHTLTLWRHRRRCANLVLTHRRVIFFSFMLSVTSSRLFVQLLVLQINVNRVVLGVTVCLGDRYFNILRTNTSLWHQLKWFDKITTKWRNFFSDSNAPPSHQNLWKNSKQLIIFRWPWFDVVNHHSVSWYIYIQTKRESVCVRVFFLLLLIDFVDDDLLYCLGNSTKSYYYT
jgi:hypothetical protein